MASSPILSYSDASVSVAMLESTQATNPAIDVAASEPTGLPSSTKSYVRAGSVSAVHVKYRSGIAYTVLFHGVLMRNELKALSAGIRVHPSDFKKAKNENKFLKSRYRLLQIRRCAVTRLSIIDIDQVGDL